MMDLRSFSDPFLDFSPSAAQSSTRLRHLRMALVFLSLALGLFELQFRNTSSQFRRFYDIRLTALILLGLGLRSLPSNKRHPSVASVCLNTSSQGELRVILTIIGFCRSLRPDQGLLRMAVPVMSGLGILFFQDELFLR
jgi:hypothetical protein